MSLDDQLRQRLGAIFDVTDRTWVADVEPIDEHSSPEGRVMEIRCGTTHPI